MELGYEQLTNDREGSYPGCRIPGRRNSSSLQDQRSQNGRYSRSTNNNRSRRVRRHRNEDRLMENMQLLEVETELRKKFNDFHKNNPKVYSELVSLAKQAKARGRAKIGMRMLYEVVRWNRYLKTTDEDYKMNNDYCAFYARKIVDENPELEGIFELRSLKRG